MIPAAFYVRRLRIKRLYGVEHDGLTADGLACGVNVIYGPNGQGKTTFGRAVHALVWPTSASELRPYVTGAFDLDREEWGVTLDGSSVRHERAGARSDAPNLPGVEERSRYRLSLHDLLQSDGAEFTQAVAKDASGGMDIEQSASALGFSARTPGKSNQTRDADAARKALNNARGLQASLQVDEAKLDALRGDREAAARARDRQAALALALEYAAARVEDEAAQATLDALPGALANVRSTDATDLQKHREQEREAREAETGADEAYSAALRVLDANAVQQAGTTAPLAELREHLAAAQEAEGIIARKRDEIAGLRSLEEDALAQIAGRADSERLATVSAEALEVLNGYFERVATLEGHLQAGKALAAIEASVRENAPAPEAAERSEKAAGVLREWLRAERVVQVGLPRTLALVGAIVCAVLGIALGFLVHPAAYALLVGAAFLIALYMMSAPREDSRLADVQARYARLDAQPLAWNAESVETRLGQAEAVHARGVLMRDAATYVAAMKTKLEGTDALVAQVEAQGRVIAHSLGLAPEVRGLHLAYALRAVQTYQEARARRVGAEREQAEATRRRSETLAQAGTRLAPFGMEPPDDVPTLSARIETLAAASGEKKDAERDRDAASSAKARAEKDRDAAAASIAALFARLGLDPESGDAAVAEAVQASSGYATAHAAAANARTRAEQSRQRLAAHAATEPGDDALAAPEAQRLHHDASGVAGRHDGIAKAITAIETRVQAAQSGREVERAMAAYQTALNALREARDDAADARLGQLLADHVAKASRESQMPPVVRRAGEILGRITAYRYSLGFDPVTKSFYATDTHRDRGFALDELSSGTRVQVLLSVRVAFVEEQERGAKLPLVLDELLANSDEERAAAITQAILELCREGRQVFYLTSQPDEVAKWRRHAEDSDVDCAFIGLGPGVEAPEAEALPHTSLTEAPPAPNGHDHDAYGAVLRIPRWSGYDDAGALHLWYAVEDPATLHTLLASGVTRIGQALGAFDAGATLGLEPPEVRRLRIYADALRAWQSGWGVGRGRRVLRETLEECPAISKKFIENVAELAALRDGDGKALLAGVRGGAIKRFHASKADDLEAYLIEHDHIDDAPRLSPGKIWGGIVERVGKTCASGEPSLADVRVFLGRIHSGPSVSVHVAPAVDA